jgi:hypothetical protein
MPAKSAKSEKSSTAKKSPFGRTQADHESKEKLVDKVVGALGNIIGGDESKDDLKARLLAASNKKLLRLLDVSSEIKAKFGSVEKAAEALAKTLGRAKDADYVNKLKTYAPARLLDLYRAAEKRVAPKKAA